MRDHFDVTGRTALVTGSSRGIGRAIALALAEYGADLAVHGVRRVADAEEVAAQVQSFGVRSLVVAADLADPAAAEKLVAAVTRGLGPIDILVLNASIEERQPWAEITLESFQRQVD